MTRIPLDPAGAPFILGALLLALAAGMAGFRTTGGALVLLAGFFVFFFRDPERHSDAPETAVLAPADGRVLVAGAAGEAAPPGAWLQVSVFLSPLDVHVNRMPVGGEVTRVDFVPGQFLAAYRAEAATRNERSEVWIDHGGQTVVARQIVGVLARRVVCRARVGATVRAGDRFGIMKFGSRMDVFLPPSATLQVKQGDRVRGGETVIAVLH